jgi:predicted metal-dependent phosphoesterase TrpH
MVEKNQLNSYIFQYPGKYQYMRFDLHIHSNYSSDSSQTVDEILKQSVKKGLDGIAICDHNTVRGSLHAIERVMELNLPLLVLPGMEVSTTDGHLLVLGVREDIPPELPGVETIRIARQKGGVVVAAHPFKIGGIGCDAVEADAVETFNSRCIFGENARARQMAESLGKPEVGGSDSHVLSTIGNGFTEIDASFSEDSVLNAIREGKTHSGGNVTPLHIVFVQVVRGIFRRAGRLKKRIHSKIFHNSGTI